MPRLGFTGPRLGMAAGAFPDTALRALRAPRLLLLSSLAPGPHPRRELTPMHSPPAFARHGSGRELRRAGSAHVPWTPKREARRRLGSAWPQALTCHRR